MFGKSKIDKEFREIVLKTVKEIKDKQTDMEGRMKKMAETDTVFECIVKAQVPQDTDIEKDKYNNFRRELETLLRDYGYMRVTATFMKKV